MLQEFGRPPDYFANPERWKGHQPTDNCPTQEWIQAPYSREQLKIDQNLDRQIHHASRSYVADYLENPADVQDKKFSLGTVFDANNFENGTIIEIRSESGHWIDGKNFSPSQPYTPLGIVCETKESGKRIALYYKVQGVGEYLYISHRDPVIEVGEVKHTKRKEKASGNSYDSVEKVNSVVILKSENGRKKKKHPFLNLIPIPRIGPQIIFN